MRVLTWVLRIHQVYSPGYMLIIYVLYIYVVYSFTSFAVGGCSLCHFFHWRLLSWIWILLLGCRTGIADTSYFSHKEKDVHMGETVFHRFYWTLFSGVVRYESRFKTDSSILYGSVLDIIAACSDFSCSASMQLGYSLGWMSAVLCVQCVLTLLLFVVFQIKKWKLQGERNRQ